MNWISSTSRKCEKEAEAKKAFQKGDEERVKMVVRMKKQTQFQINFACD